MPAELRLDRCRDLAFVQCIKRIFECWVVHPWTSKAQVATFVGRARILGNLLGDRGEILTILHARGDLVDLGLGLVVAQFTAGLDQDMRGAALFCQIGDLLLIQLLQLLVGRLELKNDSFFSSTYSTTTCSGVRKRSALAS